MSSDRAPSPAIAMAGSPDRRSSRKAIIDTARATAIASPSRFRMYPPTSAPALPAAYFTDPSLPGHLPEAHQLVRVGGEVQLFRRDVVHRQRPQRHRVGVVRDLLQRLL